MNHTLFWENLTPDETAPGTETTKAIAEAFGDLDALKADMSAKTVAVQGSGWGWLGYNTATKRIEIATCANQDPLQATTGLVPLLGIVSATKESRPSRFWTCVKLLNTFLLSFVFCHYRMFGNTRIMSITAMCDLIMSRTFGVSLIGRPSRLASWPPSEKNGQPSSASSQMSSSSITKIDLSWTLSTVFWKECMHLKSVENVTLAPNSHIFLTNASLDVHGRLPCTGRLKFIEPWD